MPFFSPVLCADPAYAAIQAARHAAEAECVQRTLAAIDLSDDQRRDVLERARGWVRAVRRRPGAGGPLDAFLTGYALTSHEGIALMCLAEALLRVPDEATMDRLIRDKLGGTDWGPRPDRRGSLFVNASTWALMLTGRLIDWHDDPATDLRGALRRRLERGGGPLIRTALRHAMTILGEQFVMGRDIDEAIVRASRSHDRHSFDMLGEAARTEADAARYQERYLLAIDAVGRSAGAAGPILGPGISIKLSALHPRLEPSQGARVRTELLPRLTALAQQARAHGIGLTIDAEEAARLDLTLDLLAALCAEPSLSGWDGLGVAVQAYQLRALPVIDLLHILARRHHRRLMVRLVKGAYWDGEIKVAQQMGLPAYPVYTRKRHTDCSYLACAGKLLDASDRLYPQFATHNAHAIAAVLAMARGRPFELQRLHGMGESLYRVVAHDADAPACRAYDPVGAHEDLLPYLVRRLLENGTNSSFVNRIADARAPVEAVVTDPVDATRRSRRASHPRIPLPRDLYRPDRANSRGVDLGDPVALGALYRAMQQALGPGWRAAPLPGERNTPNTASPDPGAPRAVLDPADRRRRVGQVVEAGPAAIEQALAAAHAAAPGWERTAVVVRANCLERAADLLEARQGLFVAMCVREAGKTVADGVAELREAADFCRWYATRARELFAAPRAMQGPTGEANLLSLHGRGVFACISPWNFPLAIFVGQVTAALAAGNAVIAKPAEQTPLIAAEAVRLLHEAGIPPEVLHLLPGDGPTVGAALIADARIAGVAFTGSLEVAQSIHRSLAARAGPILPLIAETGGQNAMVADSSALPEQLVMDVIASSFNSAGQRCSALRVLFLQQEIAEHILTMLAGAMAQLRIGDPWDLATDIGPVIDEAAADRLARHCRRMQREARLIAECPLPPGAGHGTFFAPRVFEIASLDQLRGEVFGPVLHVIRYAAADLDRVIDAINAAGYGLTFGVHSRIDQTIRALTTGVRAGNLYVNRNMVGAVVGVQPFGGEGLSGTGPKAGGPHYLQRFAVERLVSINTAAAGGDAGLLSLQDDPD